MLDHLAFLIWEAKKNRFNTGFFINCFQLTLSYFSSKDVCPISRSSVKIFTK